MWDAPARRSDPDNPDVLVLVTVDNRIHSINNSINSHNSNGNNSSVVTGTSNSGSPGCCRDSAKIALAPATLKFSGDFITLFLTNREHH